MYTLVGSGRPWLRRIDHLICEVADIEEAMRLFTKDLGFPVAWPIGRFWPQGMTSGVALGGINLEFIQPDHGAPSEARITTVVFEPVSLENAIARFQELGFPMELREKWEANPDLLRLRGFDERECQQPQLICRNLIPTSATPLDFFLCDYSPPMKARLSAEAFPEVPPVTAIVASLPNPGEDSLMLDRLCGVPRHNRGCDILVRDEPSDEAAVVAIRSVRGPLNLRDWPASFRFI